MGRISAGGQVEQAVDDGVDVLLGTYEGRVVVGHPAARLGHFSIPVVALCQAEFALEALLEFSDQLAKFGNVNRSPAQ